MTSEPAHMNPARSFQGLILTLQRYWAEQGCVILQPYDMEVGAGTFHPATTLRALGPRPWRAAYVQPSRRPKDGRYGQNPNRLQHYYQFQVILNVYDLNFNGLEGDDKVTYGDVFLQAEEEYSRHNFEHADTEMLFEQFRMAERACRAYLAAGDQGDRH